MAAKKIVAKFLPFTRPRPGDLTASSRYVIEDPIAGLVAIGEVEKQIDWEDTYSPRTGSGVANPRVRGYSAQSYYEEQEPFFDELSKAREHVRRVSEEQADKIFEVIEYRRQRASKAPHSR